MHEFVNRLPVGRGFSHAKAQSDLRVLPRPHFQMGRTNLVLRLFTKMDRLSMAAVFGQANKVVSCDATQYSCFTNCVAQSPGNFGQHSVAGLIAIRLIDRAKPNDVEPEHG